MLYRFVDEQKAEGFPIERICEVAGVSTSAYYDWKKHRDGIVGADVVRERLLVNEIRQIHKTSKGTYGSPRVTVELCNRGRVVNHKRVERLMRVHDIVGHTPKKRTVTTIPYAAHRIADLVKRDFTPDGLDVTWCGDITYIRTWEGFLYLAVVEDLASHAFWVCRWPATCAPASSVTPSQKPSGPAADTSPVSCSTPTGGRNTPQANTATCAPSIESHSRWAEPGCAGTTHRPNRSSPH